MVLLVIKMLLEGSIVSLVEMVIVGEVQYGWEDQIDSTQERDGWIHLRKIVQQHGIIGGVRH